MVGSGHKPLSQSEVTTVINTVGEELASRRSDGETEIRVIPLQPNIVRWDGTRVIWSSSPEGLGFGVTLTVGTGTRVTQFNRSAWFMRTQNGRRPGWQCQIYLIKGAEPGVAMEICLRTTRTNEELIRYTEQTRSAISPPPMRMLEGVHCSVCELNICFYPMLNQ
jgi:hypothetical protein